MKNKVLKKLKSAEGKYVSGEQLSEYLGVSRTYIWKCIKELREEGYVIESSPKVGYKLTFIPDIINSKEIMTERESKILGKNVIYFPQIDSTNNYAKKIAQEGCEEGTVVIADLQTSGRGRLGRKWSSKNKKGILMSVVLKPEISIEELQIITLAASVAVVETVKELTGIGLGVKWPNDIILDGRKVCGILTEASMEMDKINFVVLGIGLNVWHEKEDFPDELEEKATSLSIYMKQKSQLNDIIIRRSRLIIRILYKLEELYDKINKGDLGSITTLWKKYSVTLGREVLISVKGEQHSGIAIDITNEGKLVVECTDGSRKEVLSGEIYVKGLLGYQ
ncbi:MAG TPA: biotin--[acetyl-CoA-carboxylase] ligase [Ruminiclostridium sp.]|uniref:biotin--[acetyl-CoA-carboxylase] ligase n=1 Tax=Acetivibrio saccincola TaxID=1677857 RepID=UPI000A7F2ABE|nr:biotin--[acetyl-CoA-carboxylase] ligase [Acetivibrio saccincola]HAA43138.1 biotin--[acetyl-CoA-carboxylase] ligase [Ruminiclostridium sp.]